jgi:hypothetical protein
MVHFETRPVWVKPLMGQRLDRRRGEADPTRKAIEHGIENTVAVHRGADAPLDLGSAR